MLMNADALRPRLQADGGGAHTEPHALLRPPRALRVPTRAVLSPPHAVLRVPPQVGNAMSTSEKLARELTQRKVELEKIETLDEKIGAELTQLEEKKTTMASELETFEDIPRLKREAEEARSKALAQKESALATIGGLKEEAAEAKRSFDALKRKLASDDVASQVSPHQHTVPFRTHPCSCPYTPTHRALPTTPCSCPSSHPSLAWDGAAS